MWQYCIIEYLFFSEALRARYRISKEHYSGFYKEIIQETLAACLYNEGPRKQKKRTTETSRQAVEQQASQIDEQPAGGDGVQSPSAQQSYPTADSLRFS